MTAETNEHISPDEFREYARALVDWIACYHERIESLPVLSTVEPGKIRGSLPVHPPEDPESFDNILSDLDSIVVPGITHWQSPNFFAYFPSNNSWPSVLGELLTAGLAVQGMMWITSPACTELETHVLDWLVEMLDLPEKFSSDGRGGGVIQDTASSATLCALLAAREKTTGFSSNESGCDGRLVAYTSEQAHSSVEKAVKIAGIGSRNLRFVGTDDTYAMRPDLLDEQITRDRAAGLVPFFVSATVGTTSSNAVDPLSAIGEICKKHDIWLHVDAAMSGTAALCPEFRWIHRGLTFADSYCFNPHKWMFTNFDCDCFYVDDRSTLIHTLSVLPEYLRNRATESGAVIDYRDWHIPLGRRFRALKLWFVIRMYGVEGLRRLIRRHVELAQEFARWVEDSDMFDLTVSPPLNLVCFRHVGGDEFNKQLNEELNRSGRIYLTHTMLGGSYVLRFCVGQWHTEERHVREAWRTIRETAEQLAP